jgi:transposase-like protein
MGAKVSAEMKHALFLVVQEGKPVKASAKLAGVDASSLYKALRRITHRVEDTPRPPPQWALASAQRNSAT